MLCTVFSYILKQIQFKNGPFENEEFPMNDILNTSLYSFQTFKN